VAKAWAVAVVGLWAVVPVGRAPAARACQHSPAAAQVRRLVAADLDIQNSVVACEAHSSPTVRVD